MTRWFGPASVLSLSLVLAPGALAQEPEHLPARSKPPPPGVRPAGLAANAERLGVAPRSDVDRAFDRLVDDFLLVYFRAQPVRATRVGLHDYDALVPATDSSGIAAWGDELDRFLARAGGLDSSGLGSERRADHALLERRLRDELADVRTLASWRRDPGWYLRIVSGGLRALVEQDFAPLADRTWNVIARLTEVPRILPNARANLDEPGRAETEQAIAGAAQLENFLAYELPVRVAPLRDPVLGEEFDHHLAPAVGAAAEFRRWLRLDLLPPSTPARPSPAPSGVADSLARVRADREPIASALDSLLRR